MDKRALEDLCMHAANKAEAAVKNVLDLADNDAERLVIVLTVFGSFLGAVSAYSIAEEHVHDERLFTDPTSRKVIYLKVLDMVRQEIASQP